MTMDELLMQRCLQLALKGLGQVAPNPMVGSVIVADGEIIGEGYHQQFGQAHAEVNAVKSVSENNLHKLEKASLYVNLEPCSHFGKTPPCADMIIRNNIARVVIGSNDPNPKVSGQGIAKLRDAGIEVVTGVLKRQCDFFNRRFLTFWLKRRPYIILKWAQSADGFMASAEPKQVWLTGEESKKLTHQWRSEEQAILVGKRTVQIDDPALTVRLITGKNPVRITIDRNLELNTSFKFFEPNSKLIVFNAHKNEGNYVLLDFEADVLEQIMDYLFSIEVQSVIVEGGAFTLHQFIAAGLWDEARVFTAPIPLNSGKKAPVLNIAISERKKIGQDTLEIYYANL